MKIFINGRFYSQKITGVQRYSRELLLALDEILAANSRSTPDLTVLVPPSLAKYPTFKKIKVKKAGFLRGNFWEQIDLPIAARSRLLYSPGNTGPFFSYKQALTIHDASVFAVPEAYSKPFRAKYSFLYKRFAKTAKHIFTDSKFSKQELIRYCGMDSEKMSVVFPGYEHLLRVESDESILSKLALEDRNYFLVVGSLSPHKNFDVVIKALEYIHDEAVQLVVTGGKFNRVFNDRDIIFPQKIILADYVSDGQLAALYGHAKALIVPSKYEGFGFPVLEGLAFGCPVICSTAASLPEVGGDVVTYFDPDDSRQLAEILQTGAFSYDRRRVQQHLNHFQWRKCAAAVLNKLEALAE